MPRINITEKEMSVFERYLPTEEMKKLEDKILLANIPKGKECDVIIKGVDGEYVVKGIELTEKWAIAPAIRVHPVADGSVFSRTKKALVHRPSGLAAVYGTKHELLILWNKGIDDKIKSEIEQDDPNALTENSPGFVKICREFQANHPVELYR